MIVFLSRVRKPNKYVNTPKYDSRITNPSKKIRIHHENEDYHKATTLSQWLFAKYDMSYKSYRNKSLAKRKQLRNEFEQDTNIFLNEKE